jgi:hypothetical protein
LATFDAARQDWASEGSSSASRLSISTAGPITNEGGQPIHWTPTHIWRTSPLEYKVCQVLEWDLAHAKIVDNTGIHEVAHSDIQELRAEGGARRRAQARRPQSPLSQPLYHEAEARLSHSDQASWRSSSSEHGWGEEKARVGVSSLSVHLARQVAAKVDRQVEQMSAHILRALIGPRNMFL